MSPTPRLVLASTSPYRRRQLERLGLVFTQAAPRCDEEALKRPGVPPRELALELAAAKAASLIEDHPDALIIAGDQIVALGAEIFGKSGTRERAIAQLERLQGRTHELISALVLRRGSEVRAHATIARMAMRPLDRRAIERLLDADQPYDCAGCYKLESRGIAMFSSVACDDPSAIEGLPLIALVDALRAFGCELP
jgi:septum formation protein